MTTHAQPLQAAIYLRTASAAQQPRAPWLEATARAHAAARGLSVTEVYIDAGISGMTGLASRPAGARLLNDAQAGRFGTIIVTNIDRLGRDEAVLRTALATFERLGVRVEAVADRRRS